MLLTLERGYKYKITLTNGKVIIGEAEFYRASTTPQGKPIVLRTNEGIVQINPESVLICEELVKV